MNGDGTNDPLAAAAAEMTRLQSGIDASIVEGAGTATEGLTAAGQPWTPELVTTLSITVFAFGLIICGLMTMLHSKGKSATDLLRLFSLPLIIVSAVVLVIAGYSDRQISSVIGLLGTIAGYLLGSRGTGTSDGDPSATRRAGQEAVGPKGAGVIDEARGPGTERILDK